MATLLTYEQAVIYAREAEAQMGPDFVYQAPNDGGTACFYLPVKDVKGIAASWASAVPRDSPKQRTGCLVGRILLSAGVPQPVLAEHGLAIGPLIQARVFSNYVTFTKEATMFLTYVQSRQDDGASWGRAISTSIETVRKWVERSS